MFSIPKSTLKILKFIKQCYDFLDELNSISNISKRVSQNLNLYTYITEELKIYVNSSSGIDDETQADRGLLVTKPFKTLQYALNFTAYRFNLLNFGATILLADGEYELNKQILLPTYISSSGCITIRSLSGNKQNVKVGKILSAKGMFYILKDLSLNSQYKDPSNNNHCIACINYSKIEIYNCDFILENLNSANMYAISVDTKGQFYFKGQNPINVYIKCPTVVTIFNVARNSLLSIEQDVNIILTVVSKFTIGCALLQTGAVIENKLISGRIPKVTSSGENLTGRYYYIVTKGIIELFTEENQTENYFPGNTAGYIDLNNGFYITKMSS
jgi:hypothetical protein